MSLALDCRRVGTESGSFWDHGAACMSEAGYENDYRVATYGPALVRSIDLVKVIARKVLSCIADVEPEIHRTIACGIRTNLEAQVNV